MKANLAIERVGGLSYLKPPTRLQLKKLLRSQDGIEHLKYWCRERDWVAEITGFDKYGYARRFVRAKMDFSRADDKGMRGIYANYVLESGKLYEVFEHAGWGQGARRFIVVNDGVIVEIKEAEVIECLRNRSESTSAPQHDNE